MHPALLLSLLVPTGQPLSFAELQSTAQSVPRLSDTVAALLGDCEGNDIELKLRCHDKVKQVRKQYKHQVVYLDLGASHQDLLQYEGQHGERSRFLWVPLIDAGKGLALSLGRPRKLTRQGWPVLPKKVLDVRAPADVLQSDLRRLARLGQINIELIGRFAKPWSLRSKGKTVRGLSFKVKGLRLSHSRTGQSLGEILY